MVPVRALVYSRVSTDAQERDGTSLDTQERACVEYVQAKGWTVAECIKDTASGSNLDRPGIERVRHLLSQGFVDVVLAYAVDRLSRNQIHIAVLLDDIEKAGATLEFVTEDFENTPVGRLILNVRAFAGEVEREKIAERTMRGKIERARAGKLPQGTGKGCYGYRYDAGTGRREVVDEQADTVRTIFEQFITSTSCSRIAKELNDKGVPAFAGGIWHPLTVRRILQNETYTGRTVYRRTRVEKSRDLRNGGSVRRVRSQPESEWIDVPGATPALISAETFERVQAILNDPIRRLRGKPTANYRLRGHVRCLVCDTPMVGQAHAGGRYRYYRCRRSYAGYFEGKCDSRYVRVELLERLVLKEVAKVLSRPDRILSEARRLANQGIDAADMKVATSELQQVEEQQRRLTRLYVSGTMPEDVLAEESSLLSKRRSHLEAKRMSLETQPAPSVDLDKLSERLPEVAARLRRWVLEAGDKDVALILKALDLHIRASSEEVQVEGAIPLIDGDSDMDLVTIVQTSG
jgi:site-specific DNA recombinase